MEEKIKEEVARRMSEQLGATVEPKYVVMFPDDGCPGHLGLPHWEVFGARCGEFTCLAYVYDDGHMSIHIY